MNITASDIVDYPDLIKVDSNNTSFNGLLCYIIEPYQIEGYNVYIKIENEYQIVRIGDFLSNMIDPTSIKGSKLLDYIPILFEIMKCSGIAEASYYFSNCSNDLVLVDVMLCANKFLSPGMLRDIFGNLFKTQKVLKINVIDENIILENKGNIIKPSRFRCIEDGKILRPKYGIIE